MSILTKPLQDARGVHELVFPLAIFHSIIPALAHYWNAELFQSASFSQLNSRHGLIIHSDNLLTNRGIYYIPHPAIGRLTNQLSWSSSFPAFLIKWKRVADITLFTFKMQSHLVVEDLKLKNRTDLFAAESFCRLLNNVHKSELLQAFLLSLPVNRNGCQ